MVPSLAGFMHSAHQSKIINSMFNIQTGQSVSFGLLLRA